MTDHNAKAVVAAAWEYIGPPRVLDTGRTRALDTLATPLAGAG
jgi:hypothetical protein